VIGAEEERSLALSKESAQDGHLVTVMLWHGNPFHFLSGYVEVNMTVVLSPYSFDI